MEFNSERVSLVHQYGRHSFVLVHQQLVITLRPLFTIKLNYTSQHKYMSSCLWVCLTLEYGFLYSGLKLHLLYYVMNACFSLSQLVFLFYLIFQELRTSTSTVCSNVASHSCVGKEEALVSRDILGRVCQRSERS